MKSGIALSRFGMILHSLAKYTIDIWNKKYDRIRYNRQVARHRQAIYISALAFCRKMRSLLRRIQT